MFMVICIAWFNVPGYAADFKILPAPEKVSEHVYAWIGPYGGPNPDNHGFRMNMGFVVGKDAVLVFDTGFYPDMAKEMLAYIATITKAPVKYAVNSNSQPDRYFGNAVFQEAGAELIAHDLEVARMAELISKNLPNTRLKQARTINLGGSITVNLSFHKGAHTPMPLVIHVMPDNVVYAGDILYSGRLLAVVPGGNIRQWMETFDYLRTFKNATFVPGHGKPSDLKVFEASTLAYLKLLNSHMAKMIEDGVDMQDAINKLDQSAFSSLENYEDLAGRNANIAYQEAERAGFE